MIPRFYQLLLQVYLKLPKKTVFLSRLIAEVFK